jgi:hypothetical protein
MDHPAVVTFLILAVIGAMSLAAEVLTPLAMAVLLSFALAPVAGFFERQRVPRTAAVILTVVLALGFLSGIGYVVVRQLSTLAYRLPNYQERIQQKVDFLKPSDDTALRRAERVAGDVARSLDKPVVPGHEAMDVRVVDQPTFRQRLQTAVGPYLEFIGVGSFVLILNSSTQEGKWSTAALGGPEPAEGGGPPFTEAWSYLELYRLPSYSPQRNVIEIHP